MDYEKAYKIMKESGLAFYRGVITEPLGFLESKEQREAFDYLCDEWDFAVVVEDD